MKQAREFLEAVYLDWVNNYASVPTYAEHNGLTEEQAQVLIGLAKMVFTSPDPEA